MFANLHGPTAAYSGANHWLVPTGLLQRAFEARPTATNPLAGGVVRVEHTSSALVRRLFPAEATSMFDPAAVALLRAAGHSGRQYAAEDKRRDGLNAVNAALYLG